MPSDRWYDTNAPVAGRWPVLVADTSQEVDVRDLARRVVARRPTG